MDLLLSFLSAVEEDPRITMAHITLYVTLWKKWKDSGNDSPLSFFRSDILGKCKMGKSTFHIALRQLHEYGYIQYKPSFSYNEGSEVFFVLKL